MDRYLFVSRLVGSDAPVFTDTERGVRIPLGAVHTPNDLVGESLERVRARYGAYHRPIEMPYNFQTSAPDDSDLVWGPFGARWMRFGTCSQVFFNPPNKGIRTPLVRVVVGTDEKTGRPLYGWWDRDTEQMANAERLSIHIPPPLPARTNTVRAQRSGRRTNPGQAPNENAAGLDTERMTNSRCSIGSGPVTPDFEGIQREVLTRSELFSLTTPELVRALFSQAFRILNTERTPAVRNPDGSRKTPRPLTDAEQAIRRAGSVWSGIPNSWEYSRDAVGYVYCGFRWYRTKAALARTDLERMPCGSRSVLPTLTAPERLVSLISGAALAVRHDDKRKPTSLYGKTKHDGVRSVDIDRLGRVRSYALAPVRMPTEQSPLITETIGSETVRYRQSDVDTIGSVGVRVSAGRQLRQVNVRRSEPDHTRLVDARLDAESKNWWHTLTEAERDVLMMLSKQMPLNVIARNRGVSPQAVSKMLGKIRDRGLPV